MTAAHDIDLPALLAERLTTTHPDVLRELLQHCISVKTVRLCLQLGRELSLSWTAKLDPARLPTGSDRRWVSRSDDGLLVLKPRTKSTSIRRRARRFERKVVQA